MTSRVSIITATYGPKADYLADTVQSVRDQQLPEGWELEWLIQEDGAQPRLADAVHGLPGVHYAANDAQVGSAATRNFALARATGELVQVLDQDDSSYRALRTDLVRALGGWAASPIDEDVIMFSSLSELVPGYNDPATTWLYRQHEQQTSKIETSKRHSPTARRIALQRIQALSAVGLQLPTHAAPPRDIGEAEVGPAAKDAVEPGVAWWKQ